MAVDSILLVLPAALLITLVGVYTIGTGSAAVSQPVQTNMAMHDIYIGNCPNTSSTAR